jgi:hypothetical protein
MELKELIAEAKRIGEIGCRDGYCKFRGPATGQHTNGGCRCTVDENDRSRGPYDKDMVYMADLLRQIAAKFESQE